MAAMTRDAREIVLAAPDRPPAGRSAWLDEGCGSVRGAARGPRRAGAVPEIRHLKRRGAGTGL